MAKKAQRLHHYLVAGKIIFKVGETEETMQLSALDLNATLVSETQTLSVVHIGRAQQALQMHFFKRMDGAQVNVVDVVITGMCYLGLQTTEDFSRLPADMAASQADAYKPDLQVVQNDGSVGNQEEQAEAFNEPNPFQPE